MSAAEKLKASGVEKYKAGLFADAIPLFKEASLLEPLVPVYLSNLSAAEFEDGQYVAALATCDKVLSMLTGSSDVDLSLRTKVLARKSKILAFLSHDNASYTASAIACATDASRKRALDRQSSRNKEQPPRGRVNKRISSISRYRQTPETILEYYVCGHDEVNSIFRGQLNNDIGDDKSLRIKVPSDGRPFEFSALFCGIGDARHLYGSLIDVGQDYRGSSDIKNTNMHFTVIDIHPTALSRDLIVLFALRELSTLEDPSTPRAKHLLVMCHYLFLATVMPPLAGRVLDEMRDRVYDSILAAVTKDEALDLEWLYIEPKSCKMILQRLEWWRGEGKTILTFKRALTRIARENEIDSKLNEADQKIHQNDPNQRREEFIQGLKSPEQRADVEAMAAQKGMSVADVIKEFEDMTDEEFKAFDALDRSVPALALSEHLAYPYLRVLVPPPGIDEPKPLENAIFRPIRDSSRHVPPKLLEDAHKMISERWVVNYTHLDKDWLIAREKTETSPFGACVNLFPDTFEHLKSRKKSGVLFDISSRFFWLASRGTQALSKSFKIEIIVGDGYAIMDEIKLETLTRRADFPVLFDRIHASNVPDYIGGFLANFTTAVPLLKPHKAAYFTCTNLLNASLWEGGIFDRKGYLLSMNSQLYTYAGVTLPEIRSAFGVELSSAVLSPIFYHTFGRVEKPVLLSRDQFYPIATTCFWRTVLPAQYSQLVGNTSLQVREVVNVHSFFRALETWKNIGYPMHILAELVESILENRLTRSSPPHDKAPAPLSDRNGPMVSICTLPFLTEFEVAAALWEPRLFPIMSPSLPIVEDIKRYSVKIPKQPVAALMSVAPTHALLALVFGRPQDMDAAEMDCRKQIIGASKTWNNSLQFMSTFDYDTKTSQCTFLLSDKRAKTFIDGGYEVGILNTAGWKLQSSKIKCSAMKVVGNMDKWDRSINIPVLEGRDMTQAQLDAWTGQMMPPGLRGPMAAMNNIRRGTGDMQSSLAAFAALTGGAGGRGTGPDCPTQ